MNAWTYFDVSQHTCFNFERVYPIQCPPESSILFDSSLLQVGTINWLRKQKMQQHEQIQIMWIISKCWYIPHSLLQNLCMCVCAWVFFFSNTFRIMFGTIANFNISNNNKNDTWQTTHDYHTKKVQKYAHIHILYINFTQFDSIEIEGDYRWHWMTAFQFV